MKSIEMTHVREPTLPLQWDLSLTIINTIWAVPAQNRPY